MINLQNFIQKEELPSVNILPDGEYHGKLAAHCFEYNGKKYHTEIGIKTPFPQPWTVTIKDGKEVIPNYIK